jgi:hypothetical protein
MHRAFAPLAFFAASDWGGELFIAPDSALLASVRSRMAAVLRSQPNYTCLQEIERSSRQAPRGRFQLVDMLRLEVALVDGKEMFAWPGSRKFDEIELHDLVSNGAIGNGSFALHAQSVFTTNAPVFDYAGEDRMKDRRAIRFDYRVPLAKSGYHIKVNEAEALVAYHGTVWADTATLDVIRLDVIADAIPPALGLSDARDSMEYARARIGSSEFLLPAASELRMTDASGNESRNRTRFTGCRQYTGDSVISFAGPQAGAVDSPPALQAASEERTVPADLLGEVQLENDIDSSKSMVGDTITALVAYPLKTRRQIFVPKGASLTGRIARLERRGDGFVFELRFTEAIAGNTRWKLVARIHDLDIPAGLRSFERIDTTLVAKTAPQLGTLYIRGSGVRLPRGVRFTVRTEDLPAGRVE